MHDMDQQGTKKASRLPDLCEGLALLAVASLCMTALGARAQASDTLPSDALPNAPSALLFPSSVSAQPDVPTLQAQAPASPAQAADGSPCPASKHRGMASFLFLPEAESTCKDQLQPIVDTGYVKPLTSKQKGVLALRAWVDPFNLLTIAAFSGISVAADAHSDYGPGFAGWGRLAGYSFAEDAQANFTGVYLIPSLVHEDPRYHRMPKASTRRRIEHALIHPFVTQHDDGSVMPNYATLINVPLSAEISNLYVPGIGTNAPDTAKRVLVGYATEPVGPLVAEFLPDFAKRVHIHIIFAQQILNRLALGSGAQSSSF
jgi:hypothetical protein